MPQNTAQPSDVYFCELPQDEFAKELWRRLTSPGLGLTPYYGLQQKAYRAFYGALPPGWFAAPDEANSSQLTATGVEGNAVAMKANEVRVNANAQHQLVTNPALTWKTVAVNAGSASLQDAEKGGQILEYLWRQNGYERDGIEAVRSSIVAGEWFLLGLWDEKAGDLTDYVEGEGPRYTGDLRVDRVPGWDVFRDPGARTYEASPWRCARVPRNRHELAAQYATSEVEQVREAEGLPSLRELIMKAGAVTSAASLPSMMSPLQGYADPDTVWCYYFFHRPTAACPTGVFSVLLDPDTVLLYEPLPKPYADPLPLHRMAAGDIDCTPWAYSSFWECLGEQTLYDDIHSSLATNITSFGRQLISAESNQNLAMDQIADGPVVQYRTPGTPAPVPLQLTAQPDKAFDHLDKLERGMRGRLGLNDIAMGQSPGAEMNAQAFALLASFAIQQNSDLQKRYLAFVTSFGRSMLKVFKAYADEPRKVAITGHTGIAPVEKWSADDLQPVDDVYVTVGNPLEQTAAGRLTLSQLFISQGFVQTPEQLQTVVETGNMKPLTQGLQTELIYIQAENEEMLKGEMPAVKITDSHQLHIRSHREGTFTIQAREDERINEAFDEHIRQHLEQLLAMDPRMAAILGQASPPPETPAQGAEGPMPPGGPPALASPLASQPKPIDVPMPQPPALEAIPGGNPNA